MAHVDLKQGDTEPEFSETLDTESWAEHQELTEADEVRFYMEAPADDVGGGDLIVNAPMSVDETTGEVVYDFARGDTSREGEHLAEIVVTFANGEVRTVPEDGYYTIDIEPPLNRDVPPAELDSPDITVGVVDADSVTADVATLGEASVATPPQADTDVTRKADLDEHAAQPSVHHSKTDPADIAPDDLGFDTATQQELDTHTADADAHHPPYAASDVRTVVAGYLASAGSVGLAVTDDGSTLTISADTNTDTHLSAEQVFGMVSGFVAGGSNVQVAADGAANSIEISATDTNTQLSGDDVRGFVNGQTITPDKVGTSSNPTGSINTERLSTDNLETSPRSVSDVTDSRRASTTYQNTTGQDIRIHVAMGTDGSTGSQAHDYFWGVSNSSAGTENPNNALGSVTIPAESLSGGTTLSVGGVVPVGGYYRLNTGSTNEATIQKWAER